MTIAPGSRSFATTVVVDRSPEDVFAAITDVGRWWTGSIDGRADCVGDEFSYRFGDLHESRQRVIELVRGRRVVWEVIAANLTGRKDPGEWVGSRVVFDLTRVGTGTSVTFTHEGLVPELECYDDCAYAWTFFLDGSLRTLLVSGEGPTAPPWA